MGNRFGRWIHGIPSYLVPRGHCIQIPALWVRVLAIGFTGWCVLGWVFGGILRRVQGHCKRRDCAEEDNGGNIQEGQIMLLSTNEEMKAKT